MSYPNWVFSMFTFFGFVISMIPLPWHLEAWNTGTCLFMIWTGLACLNQFINSVVWTGNAINWAPVWCDISARFITGSSVAIPAASLCINRRLYYIATANAVTVSKAEKRRAVMTDLAIGLGIPVLEMIVQYIDQGHRFDIYEDIGCFPFTYNTWVAFVLVNTWPLAIGCVSACYCILSIRAFKKRHAQFKELLSSNSNLNSNRYFRLMCLAATDICCTIPLSSYSIYLNATTPISPWISWEDTHFNFSRVRQIPSVIWHINHQTVVALELSRWFPFVCAVVFFAYFGFADEARKNYRAAFGSVAKRVGYTTSGSMGTGFGLWSSTGLKSKSFGTSSNGRSGALPVFVNKQISTKRDSLESFTNMSSSDVGNEFKEKSFSGDTSFGAMSLADVGGTLADYKTEGVEFKSTRPTSFLEPSPTATLSPPLPTRAAARDEEHHLEISSIRHLSSVSVSIPEPTLDMSNVPRHFVDAPSVAHRDPADVV